ncbi:hypothetical protein SUDANB51_06742 [Streptomyces sp. enrichment culture]
MVQPRRKARISLVSRAGASSGTRWPASGTGTSRAPGIRAASSYPLAKGIQVSSVAQQTVTGRSIVGYIGWMSSV